MLHLLGYFPTTIIAHLSTYLILTFLTHCTRLRVYPRAGLSLTERARASPPQISDHHTPLQASMQRKRKGVQFSYLNIQFWFYVEPTMKPGGWGVGVDTVSIWTRQVDSGDSPRKQRQTSIAKCQTCKNWIGLNMLHRTMFCDLLKIRE